MGPPWKEKNYTPLDKFLSTPLQIMVQTSHFWFVSVKYQNIFLNQEDIYTAEPMDLTFYRN